MEDIRSSEQILTDVADEAKIAFNAELDFFEWRADHEYRDLPGLMTGYVEWVEAGEPLARSYARIATEFPQHMRRFQEIVLPIQREILGTL